MRAPAGELSATLLKYPRGNESLAFQGFASILISNNKYTEVSR